MMTDHLDEAVRIAKAFAKEGLFAEAFQRLADVEQDNVAEPELWATRSYVSALAKDYGSAERDITTAIELDPSEIDYAFTRGRYRLNLKKFDGAIDDFTRVLRLCDRQDSEYYREAAYLFRAYASLDSGAIAAARADCEHVRDDAQIFVGTLRTKHELLAECSRRDRRST